jgi:hypothetical protein
MQSGVLTIRNRAMKDYERLEPTEKQIRVANNVMARIIEHNPKAEVEITIKGSLVFVGSQNTYLWYLFQIGSRGAIVNCFTKRSTRFPENQYRM